MFNLSNIWELSHFVIYVFLSSKKICQTISGVLKVKHPLSRIYSVRIYIYIYMCALNIYYIFYRKNMFFDISFYYMNHRGTFFSLTSSVSMWADITDMHAITATYVCIQCNPRVIMLLTFSQWRSQDDPDIHFFIFMSHTS